MKKQILLIEDDTAIAEVITLVLTQAGYDVIVDATGSFILKYTDTHPKFNLAIVDYLLPHVTGDIIIKKIKTHPKLKNIKIILMSANSVHELRSIGKSLLVDSVLAKPFDVDELIQLVEKLINN